MTTASLELSKELYELSVWEELGNVPSAWYGYIEDEETVCYGQTKPEGCIPAYDLGFLLRKLPYFIDTKDARGTFEFFLKKTWDRYHAGYNKPESGQWVDYDDGQSKRYVWKVPQADTPEDAVCKLAIELFKQGVLKK